MLAGLVKRNKKEISRLQTELVKDECQMPLAPDIQRQATSKTHRLHTISSCRLQFKWALEILVREENTGGSWLDSICNVVKVWRMRMRTCLSKCKVRCQQVSN